MSDPLWIVDSADGVPRFKPFDRDAAAEFVAKDQLRRPYPQPVSASRGQIMRWESVVRDYESVLRELREIEPIRPTITWETP